MKSSVFARSGRGFTLVELMVVMAIILVLAGIGVTGWLEFNRKQTKSIAKTQIGQIGSALEEYRTVNGSYPVGEGSNLLFRELYWNALDGDEKVFLEQFSGGSWIEGDDQNAKVVDPWGNEYGYVCVGEKNPEFDLWSAGPDGKADPDDINAPENGDNIGP